jgi:SAM-dependent methyltransferase
MPTLRRALEAVFGRALPPLLAAGPLAARRAAAGRAPTCSPLVVDLGSGDGRVVIEAARRGFRSVGYEINPLLVGVSVAWAAADRHKWRLGLGQPWPATGSARFYCRDLWGLDLSQADVVFVYGLTPIMERLSVKLLTECPHAVVSSNVFELNPRLWRRVFSGEEAFVYLGRATGGDGSATASTPTAATATTTHIT